MSLAASSAAASQALPGGYRYSAFISYNHRDRRAASWLHRALETYRVPKHIRGRECIWGPIEERLPPLFQDREELAASSDLAASVRLALEQSASLVVVCSPAAAKSRWVNEEIRTFTALGRRDRIQCLIVGGERQSGAQVQEYLPPALFEDGGTEPLAADIRPGQDDRFSARLKILAGILGVGYDELRQREQVRRNRRMAVFTGLSTAGFLVMTGLATAALLARNEAVHQRDIAREKTLTAERTVSFVKSLFTVADPSEARGETITAREILDRGARELNVSLGNEPTVKAELTTTLGEVYSGLGLFRQGQGLIRQGLAIPGVDPATRTRQLAALGEAQWREGDDQGAARTQAQAVAAAQRLGPDGAALLARAKLGLSDAQIRLEDYPKAEANAREALALNMRTAGPQSIETALTYERLGEVALYSGQLPEARTWLERGLAIRLKQQGESHPLVADDLNTLASIAYLQHDRAGAEAAFRRALHGYEAVLGPDHPQVAGALNNLARTLLERQAFAEAEPMLQRSVRIDLAQKDADAADLVFEYANLGIAQRGLGRMQEADATLKEAERLARLNKHRNLAPIMVERAEIACLTGRPAAGAALAEQARPIMAAAYESDPWRTAWADVVRGDCLARAGQADAGRKLVADNAPVVAKRWDAASLYGARLSAIEQRLGHARGG